MFMRDVYEGNGTGYEGGVMGFDCAPKAFGEGNALWRDWTVTL